MKYQLVILAALFASADALRIRRHEEEEEVNVELPTLTDKNDVKLT